MSKIKSTNALMKYLRNKHKIAINGSSDKTALLNMGYYHGYKGCRFYCEKTNKFALSAFYQVQAIYNFDSQLKALLYPKIMFIETALKNYALQSIVEYGNSCVFSELFDSCFNAHNDYPRSHPLYNDLSKKRVDLKSKIYNDLSKNFNNPVIGHFYSKDEQVPIWALFEILTLGEFNKLFECLNKKLRQNISSKLNINQAFDSDGKVLYNMIMALKDLRNAIAHNGFIYDNRFNKRTIGLRLEKYFRSELCIFNMKFKAIVDYIILIAYLLKCLKVKRVEINKFIRQFIDICDTFYNNIKSLSIYNKILPTDTRNKIINLVKNL